MARTLSGWRPCTAAMVRPAAEAARACVPEMLPAPRIATWRATGAFYRIVRRRRQARRTRTERSGECAIILSFDDDHPRGDFLSLRPDHQQRRHGMRSRRDRARDTLGG